MKRLLINIKRKLINVIILLCLVAVPVFSGDFVPLEEFNEVLNQLEVSNDMLLKVQEANEGLTRALELKDLDFSTLIQQKDKEIQELSLENTALIEENNSLRTTNSEILAQLIISDNMIKSLVLDNKDLIHVNEELIKRINESNKILTRVVKFSVGLDVVYMDSSFGGGISFSYMPIKHLSIDVGLLYSYPNNFVPRLGLSFLW